MRKSFDVLSICLLSSLLYSLVLSGTVAERKLRTHLKEDVGFEADIDDSLENLSKRSPYLDPVQNDVYTLFKAEPALIDPEAHGVYTLWDREEVADNRVRRSLYSILRSKQLQRKAKPSNQRKPKPSNQREAKPSNRRSLFSIIRGMHKKPVKSPDIAKPAPAKAVYAVQTALTDSGPPVSDPEQNSVSLVNASLADKNASLADKNASLDDKNASLADKNASMDDKNASLADKNASLDGGRSKRVDPAEC